MSAVVASASATGFVSILAGGAESGGVASQPSYFCDLSLDRVEAALCVGREGDRLEEFFRHRLDDEDAVRYRQDVFRDLDKPAIRGAVDAFAASMDEVRLRLARATTRSGRDEQARWFLDGCRAYLAGVRRLAADLACEHPEGAGLRGVLAYLDDYLRSDRVTALHDDATRVAEAVAGVRYNVWLRGARVTVAPYDDEADLSVDIARTFARFRPEPDAEPERSPRAGEASRLDPLEGRILDRVALVFPEEFAALDGFRRAHDRFIDPVIGRFDREVQFYLAYLDLIAPLRDAGLSVHLPRVSGCSKEETASDTFDLALALQMVAESRPVVTNDLSWSGAERIIVITGPNNGGKTTTARTIGQLHHLAALGCPVPGRHGAVFLCDAIYTHFERREDPAALTGKLGEELQRFAADFARATSRSLVIMNEMFSSTSASDALELSLAMLTRVDDLDALGVCVTFLDELADFGPTAVSLVCGVDPDDPAIRTFRIERRRADGRAYARALARRHGLSADQLERRVRR